MLDRFLLTIDKILPFCKEIRNGMTMDFVNAINATLDKYSPSLSNKSRSEIADLCTVKEIKKNDLLLVEGKLNHQEYILLDGIFRSFLLNSKGKEITISFFSAQSVLSPALTRTSNGRSLLNFQALTDARLAEMDAAKFEVLIEDNLEIREFANIVVRVELMDKVNKEIRLASWTALERLEHFRKDYRHFENIVAHHMVASYLGITNVSLSRLRGKKK